MTAETAAVYLDILINNAGITPNQQRRHHADGAVVRGSRHRRRMQGTFGEPARLTADRQQRRGSG
jgi:hypothetical protein